MKGSQLLIYLIACALLSVVAVGAVSAAETDETSTALEDRSANDPGVLGDEHIHECAATPPDDHAPPDGGTNGTIGWVEGYWYDQTLNIDGETLTEDELEELAKRTAARVEALRCLPFDEVPPLDFLTRDEYRADLEGFFETEITEAEAHFENARLATLLLVGQDEDALDVQLENRVGFPSAFYDTEEEYMGFITNDTDEIQIDQVTLAHELLHALQDQHYSIETVFDEPTSDDFMSSLAVLEGDAVLLDGMYDSNCLGQWEDACLDYQPPFQEPASWGLTLEQLAAYNMPFVEDVHAEDGWSGVNAVFDAMPNSTVEVMKPELYGEFERTELTIEDQSSDDWNRISVEEGPDYDIIGQHGLTSILIAPLYEESFVEGAGLVAMEPAIIDIQEFFPEFQGGHLNYDHSATDGWQSDQIYGYMNDDGELGSVWKIAWEESTEANTFADAFEDLVEHHGGEPTDGYANIYTFEDSDRFDMALGLERADDRIWVVTAPTVDGVTEIHEDFEAVDVTDENGDADDSDGTAVDEDDGDTDAETDAVADDDADVDTDDEGPGFGVIVAIFAILGSIFVLHHRRG